ncbi:MAG: hypothetical protein ACRDMK_09680 [Gaiellaceae bacterium]
MTTKADQVIDRAADSLRRFADRAATEGGIVAMFAEPLAEDATFIRKLKPSLIIARAKGEAPTNQPAGSGAPTAPTAPNLSDMPKAKNKGDGPNPLLIVGAAFVAGIVVAKLIDWRGHAHPRD